MAEPAVATSALPAAPQSLADAQGAPQFGLYSGSVAEARFAQLKPAIGLVERRSVEKRWQYVLVTTPEVIFSLAIVDAGYLSTGFCALFDRGSRRLLVDSNPVFPPLFASVNEEPADGLKASLRGPLVKCRIERSGGRILVSGDWAHAKVELALDARRAPAPMSAIAPVGESGRFDFTQKLALVPVEGEIRAANSTFSVQNELAALDYTHGLLARETSWRWAFGQKDGVAFNFSDGFLQGAGENVAWIDGEPRPTGPVTFHHGAADEPWQIRGPAVELTFEPEGHRAQDLDLSVIASRYVQPFGTFTGTILGVAVDGSTGVTEDHSARW